MRHLCPLVLLPLFLPSFLFDDEASASPEPVPRRVELRLASAASVRAVATDGEVSWAATTGGLLRVSAAGEARLFTGADGLPSGRLHALLVADGGLWVGGEGGLVLVQATSAIEIKRRLALKDVRALARFQDRLFIGTWSSGLYSLGGREARPREHRRGRQPLEAVTSLAAVGEELYIASAAQGLLRLAGTTVEQLPSSGLPSRVIWSLASDGEKLWVASLGGLALVEGGKVAPSVEARLAARLPVRDLRAVQATGDGLLVGSFGGGAHRLRAGVVERLPGLPPEGRVTSFAAAGSTLLVGTEGGLHVRRGAALQHVLPEGPPSNDISALAQGRDGLWVGTFDAGLALYRDGRWRRFDRGSGLVDDWVNHLAVQRVGEAEHLWVATPKGLSRFDGARWTTYLPGRELAPGHVNSVSVSGARVIVASSKGLSLLEEGRWQRLEREQGLPLRNVTAAVAGAGGELWVGGMDGLARYQKGRWSRFQVATGELPDDWVTALASTPEGIWAGTYNRGLALGSKSWRQYREGDSMPCGWVNAQALASIDGALWIGTMEGGLLTLAPSSSRWQRLDLEGGLPSMDVTAVAAAPGGRVWVGTRAGLVLLAKVSAGRGP